MPQLDFGMQQQQQDNWCWAAVAASVSMYWRSTRVWGQCDIVNAELPQTVCCSQGDSLVCNVPAKLSDALSVVQHLNTFMIGSISYDNVCAELDSNRPLCLRIVTGGLGHFVAITGYVDGDADQRLVIDDPGHGRGRVEVPYETVLQEYYGSGVWTHTYFVQ